jgi:hypothetical protein
MENRSSGAPYAASLFVKLLHIIRKKEKDIEVEYYGGVQFVEEPSIKNMLKEKAETEMKENLNKNLKFFQERVEAMKSGGGDEPPPPPGTVPEAAADN